MPKWDATPATRYANFPQDSFLATDYVPVATTGEGVIYKRRLDALRTRTEKGIQLASLR
jgi:hypothetical protein